MRARDEFNAYDEWVVIVPPAHPFWKLAYGRATDLAQETVFTHDGCPQDAKRLPEPAERTPASRDRRTRPCGPDLLPELSPSITRLLAAD